MLPLRAVLAAIEPPHVDISGDMEELQELVATAGAESVDAIVQRRALPDPGSFLGKGKLEELQELVKEEAADLVIVVTNDAPPPAPPTTAQPAGGGYGTGLLGLAERLRLYGGTLETGRTSVTNRLPVRPGPFRSLWTRRFRSKRKTSSVVENVRVYAVDGAWLRPLIRLLVMEQR